MQEGLARYPSADKEVYESISSDGEADFTRFPLIFPELPQRMPSLYNIYADTADKIKQLTQKVTQLEEKILEMERYKNSSRFEDSEVYTCDDVEQESQFMIKYEKKCVARQQEFHSLAETYSGLKKLSLQANICHNPTLVALIRNYLIHHREVIAYTSLPSSFLILSKQTHPARKRVHQPTLPNRNDSGNRKERRGDRSRSRDDNDQLQEKDEVCYTIQLVNPDNLVFQLDSKVKEIGEDFSHAGLEQVKNNVEKEVSVVRRVKIPSTKSKLISATYSQEHHCFVLLDDNGKLTVTDDVGSPKGWAKLGKNEDIVLLEIKGEELWMGSAEGVLRQYSLLDLKIKRVVACHFQQQYEVSCYLLIGSPKTQKVVYSIHRGLYELDLNTCDIRKVGEVAERIKYTVGNYLISPQQIARLSLNKDKYQILRSEVLNQWYYSSSICKTNQKILLLDQSQGAKVIIGSAQGDLRVIKL